MRARYPLISAILLAGIALFTGADLIEDYHVGLSLEHFAIHIVILVLSGVLGLVLWWRMRAHREEAGNLTRDLAAARADGDRWRGEAGAAIQDFGQAIDRQFTRWQLTDAERQIAMLLLKGLSHKEIAGSRSTSERTVRQQALALYRKSGLSGRTELAAFFLEDLLAAAPQTVALPDYKVST